MNFHRQGEGRRFAWIESVCRTKQRRNSRGGLLSYPLGKRQAGEPRYARSQAAKFGRDLRRNYHHLKQTSKQAPWPTPQTLIKTEVSATTLTLETETSRFADRPPTFAGYKVEYRDLPRRAAT